MFSPIWIQLRHRRTEIEAILCIIRYKKDKARLSRNFMYVKGQYATGIQRAILLFFLSTQEKDNEHETITCPSVHYPETIAELHSRTLN